MRLLIIDPTGAGLDTALRAMRDGHQVKLFIKDSPKTLNIGKGLVDRINDFRPWVLWADLIFCTDNTLYLHELDAARKKGAIIIGPSVETASWELDRDVGMKVLRKCGIAVPPVRTFADYDSAIGMVKRTMGRFVSKPSGDADKALSYVSKSPEDMVYMLERWKKNDKLKGDFILQEFIGGTEMAVGGWFGPHGFNAGWCENFEFKKLMNGDKGVATGEQGTVVRYVAKSKLADKVLAPLADLLASKGYVGYIDVNCIIDDSGTPWPLEFTMRPGWPTYNIQQALHAGDSVQWLADLAAGKDAKNAIMDMVAIGVVLSIPDYPYSHITRKDVTGIPIYGIKPALWKNVHPGEMMLANAPLEVDGQIITCPMPATAGDYVLVMSATGETIRGAKKLVYRRLESLIVPNSPMWRTDIGDRLAKQLPKIQAHGYAMGLTY